MKRILTSDRTASPGSSRRSLLRWMVGIAAGAFAVSFAVPAAALKSLALEKPVIAPGDVLAYADATAGGEPGQPFKATDLPVHGSVQVFPLGKESNQDNVVQIVRVAPGDGVDGLVAYSAVCTHLGCTVNQKLNRDNLMLCPCHGSIYDPANHAAVRRGPSNRALPSLSIAGGPNGTVLVNGQFDGPIGPQ